MGCAVASDGDKAPITLLVGLASEMNGMAGPRRSDDVNAQAAAAQASDCRARELDGPATASSGVNDSEEAFAFHQGPWLSNRSLFHASQCQNRRGTV